MIVSQEFVVDQQLRQIQNVSALRPINGPQMVGVDGSKTPPQVGTMVSPMDGELPRPSTLGTDFYRKARDIRRDPTIRMVRELAMAPLLMAEWEYEAKAHAPQGMKELVESVMSEMRLTLLRTSLCGITDFGWQGYEVIAEAREDGTNGMRLKPLLQDISAILVNAADGSFFGIRQTPMIGLRIGWIYMLDDECFVISQDVEGTNWYGEPTLRSCEPAYDEAQVIAKNMRKYEAKIAGSHWVIYYPLGTSTYDGVETDNGEIAKQILAKAEAVNGIILPASVVATTDALNAALANNAGTQWRVELLSDQGKGQTPFIEMMKYLDVLKVRAFGFPERSILEGQFGTKAEAEAHADIAMANLEVRHAMLCAQYNQKIVNKILRWNYGPGSENLICIHPSPLADDKKAFFEKIYLALLSNPQSFVTELSSLDLKQFRDRLGLPELKYEDMYGDYGNMQQQDMNGMPAFPLVVGGTGAYETTPMPLTWEFSHERSAINSAIKNTDTNPSKQQSKAGNYRKGKARIHGLTVSIENPKGTRRRKEWPKLSAHYGYINRHEGADGDQVDVFVGNHPDSEIVYVIDHLDQKTGQFDEHKVMMGFKNKQKAVEKYKENYPPSWKVGRVTAMTMGQFKRWLRECDLSEPAHKEISMSGFDPNEARDEKGQWTTSNRSSEEKHILKMLKKEGKALGMRIVSAGSRAGQTGGTYYTFEQPILQLEKEGYVKRTGVENQKAVDLPTSYAGPGSAKPGVGEKSDVKGIQWELTAKGLELAEKLVKPETSISSKLNAKIIEHKNKYDFSDSELGQRMKQRAIDALKKELLSDLVNVPDKKLKSAISNANSYEELNTATK